MKNEIRSSVVVRAIRLTIKLMRLLKIEVKIVNDIPTVVWFKFEGGCLGTCNRELNLIRLKPVKGFFSSLVHEVVHCIQIHREDWHIPYWDRPEEVEARAVEGLLAVLTRNSFDGSEEIVREAIFFAERITTTLTERVKWIEYLLGGTWKPHHLRRKMRMEASAIRRKVLPS